MSSSPASQRRVMTLSPASSSIKSTVSLETPVKEPLQTTQKCPAAKDVKKVKPEDTILEEFASPESAKIKNFLMETPVKELSKSPIDKEAKREQSRSSTPVVSPRSKTKSTPLKAMLTRKRQRSQEPTMGSQDSNPKNKDSPRGRSRARVRKRRRCTTDSSSDDDLDGLPENAEEVDRKVAETAARNNLDQDSVKKILKKVVTNDHVLALVALREEEEEQEKNTIEEQNKLGYMRREVKLTRAKAKELTKETPGKVAPGCAVPWNLELTPIKHIPVKTRPEVTALMEHELPDESDDDYVPSDEDPTLESCSDLDSQPRTPATPASIPPASPQPELHNPDSSVFKVPTTPTPKKKQTEEPTIALRTRSKLCLSSTPIESIEESFVPPDVPPAPSDKDVLWTDFLNEVLDPEITSFRNEDDEEADPEYNVAADQDADDEDEALERSLDWNISKKELYDLFSDIHELVNMTPQPEFVAIKQQTFEEDPDQSERQYASLDSQPKSENTVRLGQNNMVDVPKMPTPVKEEDRSGEEDGTMRQGTGDKYRELVTLCVDNNESVMESAAAEDAESDTDTMPRILRNRNQSAADAEKVDIIIVENTENSMEPTQVLILQQQLRQHIQLATSSYMQVYVHPKLHQFGPIYKQFLVSLNKMADTAEAEGRRSSVNVCNLRPALNLALAWEKTFEHPNEENLGYIKFLDDEAAKCVKRHVQNAPYTGTFHALFLETISNSPVFVYPYLLPPVPARPDRMGRINYTSAEDALIALGLEQFSKYVAANPKEFPLRNHERNRTLVVGLMVKHMFPWLSHRAVAYHIQNSRKKDNNNPIRLYLEEKRLQPVQHKLLSYHPNMTLHEHPEYELPLQWARHVSKDCQRAKIFALNRARYAGHEPAGVDVEIENLQPPDVPLKTPQPLNPTQEATDAMADVSITITPLAEQNPTITITKGKKKKQSTKRSPKTKHLDPKRPVKYKLPLPKNPTSLPVAAPNMALIPTENGGFLVPIMIVSHTIPSATNTLTDNSKGDVMNTVDSISGPIVSAKVTENLSMLGENGTDVHFMNDTVTSTIYHDDSNEGVPEPITSDTSHCQCCQLMRTYRKKWPLITNYFKTAKDTGFICCRKIPHEEKITPRLKALVDIVRSIHNSDEELEYLTDSLKICDIVNSTNSERVTESLEDRWWATSYVSRLALGWPDHLRTVVVNTFSKFQEDKDDPVLLYKKVSAALDSLSSQLTAELLSTLTPLQAERVGRYPMYFRARHLRRFIDILQEETKNDRSKQKVVLEEIFEALGKSYASSCTLCSRMLASVRFSRRLCEHVFASAAHCGTVPVQGTNSALTPLLCTVTSKEVTVEDVIPAAPKSPGKTEVFRKSVRRKNTPKKTAAGVSKMTKRVGRKKPPDMTESHSNTPIDLSNNEKGKTKKRNTPMNTRTTKTIDKSKVDECTVKNKIANVKKNVSKSILEDHQSQTTLTSNTLQTCLNQMSSQCPENVPQFLKEEPDTIEELSKLIETPPKLVLVVQSTDEQVKLADEFTQIIAKPLETVGKSPDSVEKLQPDAKETLQRITIPLRLVGKSPQSPEKLSQNSEETLQSIEIIAHLDEKSPQSLGKLPQNSVERQKAIKTLPLHVEKSAQSNEESEQSDEPIVNVPPNQPEESKAKPPDDTEIDKSMYDSDAESPLVISMDTVHDPVNTERVDWTREQDKILLNEIAQTPANKTISEALEDLTTMRRLAETIKDKTERQISDRIRYLYERLCSEAVR